MCSIRQIVVILTYYMIFMVYASGADGKPQLNKDNEKYIFSEFKKIGKKFDSFEEMKIYVYADFVTDSYSFNPEMQYCKIMARFIIETGELPNDSTVMTTLLRTEKTDKHKAYYTSLCSCALDLLRAGYRPSDNKVIGDALLKCFATSRDNHDKIDALFCLEKINPEAARNCMVSYLLDDASVLSVKYAMLRQTNDKGIFDDLFVFGILRDFLTSNDMRREKGLNSFLSRLKREKLVDVEMLLQKALDDNTAIRGELLKIKKDLKSDNAVQEEK